MKILNLKRSSLIIFSIVFCVIGPANLSHVFASNLITLTNGQVQCADPADRPYCIPEQELFSDLVINIADNGEVSGELTKPISFEHAGRNDGIESFSGTASINIRGSYDYYTRTITGKFDYKANLTYIVQRSSGDSDPLSRTSDYSEKPFTGKVDGDSLTIDFNKSFNVTYTGIPASGSIGKLDEEMDDWAVESGAAENERNSKIETGNIDAALGEAVFSDMFGQVEVNTPQSDGTYDDEDWTFGKLNGKTLPVGTHIKTSDKSGATLRFGQLTINLGPESELIISPVPGQPGSFELLWGNLKANVNKMIKGESLDFETSQSVVGIKGTIFVLEETKEKSILKVIEGTVSFKSKADGSEETVSAGEIISADKNGLAPKTTFDISAENSYWDTMQPSTVTPASQPDNILIYAGIAILVIAVSGTAFMIGKKKK